MPFMMLWIIPLIIAIGLAFIIIFVWSDTIWDLIPFLSIYTIVVIWFSLSVLYVKLREFYVLEIKHGYLKPQSGYVVVIDTVKLNIPLLKGEVIKYYKKK